jgi:hypothetical protein
MRRSPLTSGAQQALWSRYETSRQGIAGTPGAGGVPRCRRGCGGHSGGHGHGRGHGRGHGVGPSRTEQRHHGYRFSALPLRRRGSTALRSIDQSSLCVDGPVSSTHVVQG